MSPGAVDAALVRRHLLSLDAAVQTLRRHAGKPLALLRDDTDERWTVERGLQLCAQNCLDVATHLAASAGRDAPGNRFTGARSLSAHVMVQGEHFPLPISPWPGLTLFSPRL